MIAVCSFILLGSHVHCIYDYIDHVSHLRSNNIIIRTCFCCTLFIIAFRFGFEQSSYSVIESDEEVSVCVTADRGDGSEMYTLSLTSIIVTSQGIRTWFSW